MTGCMAPRRWKIAWRALLLVSCLGALPASDAVHSNATGIHSCPLMEQGDCGQRCQLVICKALVAFYNSTYNSTVPWQNDHGWNRTSAQRCESIMSSSSVAAPSYCTWHGVGCCKPVAHSLRANEQHAQVQECSPKWSVKALDLQVNNLNGSISSQQFLQSLLQLHACGLVKLQLQGNELSGTVEAPEWGQLTGLHYLDLANNWISGTISESLRQLRRLTRLSLGTNQLHGSLPVWLGTDLPALETLNLGANTGLNPDGGHGITGTIPASLGLLQNLTVLNLELNALVGALPVGLCGPETKLRALKLRGNRLSGKIEALMGCHSLTQLDISSNNFSGAFGDNGGAPWPQLAVLDASSNNFEGPLPLSIYELPVLEFLNLASNRFSGPIRRHIMQSSYLREINLEFNQLSGPIHENLWMLPHLRLLDLSHNTLTGTISALIGRTSNLEELQLGYNNLSGPLPPQLGLLKKIYTVNVVHNDLFTCLSRRPPSEPSTLSDTATAFRAATANSSIRSVEHCEESELLPCFLYFGNYTLPRTDSSNMACPAILRRRYAEAQAVCSGDGQLGKQSHNVADALADDQSWKIEPSYYQYKGCRCFAGFKEVWRSNHTLLSCVPLPPPQKPPWVNSLIEAISVSGAMLLVAAGLLVWLRMAVQLRPRWQREKELHEHRKKGVPCGGPATIVVTDIERYSELMQSNAPLATKALGIHNSILRRAANTHAGHVIEQEGDSWSVAFHTPMDAVAFCLQVQQALEKTNWPRDLGVRCNASSKTSCNVEASDTVSAGAGTIQAGQPQLQPWELQVPHNSCNGWVQSSSNNGAAVGIASMRLIKQHIARRWLHSADAETAAAACYNQQETADGSLSTSHHGANSAPYESPFAGMHGLFGSGNSSSSTVSSTTIDDVAAVGPSSTVVPQSNRTSSSFSAVITDSAMLSDNLRALDSTQVGPENASGWGIASRLRRNSNGGSKTSGRFWSIIGLNFVNGSLTSKTGQAAVVVQGLRVRMGVASGVVPADANIGTCSLLELAKAVSDMAHGGQVLLEASCFAGIRDRLTELGGVDHKGYNDIQLAHAARAAMRHQTSGLLSYCLGSFSSCLGCRRGGHIDNDALLLDMGEYYCPNLAPVIPAASSGCSSSCVAGHIINNAVQQRCMQRMLTAAGVKHAAAAAAAAAAVKAGGRTPCLHTLQLYSVLPRPLANRAKLWGSELNVKEEWQQMARAYFDAPGADMVELQPSAALPFASPYSLSVQLPVTLVFCAVEGARTRVHRRPEVARVIHNTMSKLMQALLLALPERDCRPDGYLCRQQEGELKYMLAFLSPARAMEWALLLQEVLLHVPWSAQVLEAFEPNCTSPPIAAAAAAEMRISTGSAGGRDGSCSGSSSGRPHLNIGLAEGMPQSVGPDHLGRADYHGPSVNLAARMLAAASGGQVVTSMEVAQTVFSTWCYETELLKCQHAMAVQPKQTHHEQQQQRQLDAAHQQSIKQVVVLRRSLEQTLQQQQQQQHAMVNGGLQQRDNIRCSSENQQQELLQEPSSSNGTGPVLAPVLLASQSSCNGLASAAAAKPPALQAGRQQQSGGSQAVDYPQQQVQVSGWHIGTYSFKGCGTLDMVTCTADSMAAAAVPHQQQYNKVVQPHPPQQPAVQQRSSKGTLIVPRTGPVVGLQHCPIVLPDVLPVLQKAWEAAAVQYASPTCADVAWSSNDTAADADHDVVHIAEQM